MKTTVKYDIKLIKEEALELVKKKLVNRQQQIYTLCKYIPHRDWINFELELEKNEFLLRDRIIDLLEHESWDEDGSCI
ncbi:hypothetical protein VF14_21145 [Nostoc linckia z18]|jgi:hypothetical protein|uniref:DUF4327 family protein n=3 Tax=Nostoc TaxID=1177 RepID=A0A9Q5Z9G1_NOSLI|nr:MULTISPECIES: DUF4327 family protein [Nostoc]MBL1202906.1 DUF4327 family protein [Nostoc sp. GBBB01]MDZ8014271.1 DUF4327 family protein [Nostoc sp. ZfuVER08]PHK34866.1 hypothetical protein VF12_23340 [Nostoc linckia z15]PHK44617.1 hypothetical protein VF13_20945 [Nostoc linckia z16]MBC1240403.1 DUF4327 family protein [Nostoc sp. 2RC]